MNPTHKIIPLVNTRHEVFKKLHPSSGTIKYREWVTEQMKQACDDGNKGVFLSSISGVVRINDHDLFDEYLINKFGEV